MRAIAEPAPAPTWDIIWVLSGPEVSIDDPPAHNATRRRLLTGFTLARAVTALRLARGEERLAADDLRQHGPTIYFNGWASHNQALRASRDAGVLERQYGVPRDKLLIASAGIRTTKDQTATFPADLAQASRTTVIVTDAYHIPRVRRYMLRPTSPLALDRLVYFPARPLTFPLKATLRELRKIPRYTRQGDLPDLAAFPPKGMRRPARA
jgi:hypothetical protein